MRKSLVQLVAIVAISMVAAATTWWTTGPPERITKCDPSTLKDGEICLESIPADQDVLWVDARLRRHWQSDGVPGSILWNLDPTEDMNAFEADAVMNVATKPYVVVYCDDEHCGTSRQIAQRIRNLDLGADVFVLHGGWRTLNQAGLTRSPSQTP